ncbi:MAG TPA: hypothetical protein PKN13_03940 [Accumulibacter sp.]|nr:hypothetical protein [Accumulibacter sp.]HMW18435.1 hypothetical protein [Accumulibacter sp.]HMX22109.1 hypothetical protein [Accumulibacter sp.]HMY06367.1 hypothetical protein [Accumulibacter sp.]HNC18617.1 hypothetical protein [Accumulibacter sp.]
MSKKAASLPVLSLLLVLPDLLFSSALTFAYPSGGVGQDGCSTPRTRVNPIVFFFVASRQAACRAGCRRGRFLFWTAAGRNQSAAIVVIRVGKPVQAGELFDFSVS